MGWRYLPFSEFANSQPTFDGHSIEIIPGLFLSRFEVHRGTGANHRCVQIGRTLPTIQRFASDLRVAPLSDLMLVADLPAHSVLFHLVIAWIDAVEEDRASFEGALVAIQEPTQRDHDTHEEYL